jgi:hypothetical protein
MTRLALGSALATIATSAVLAFVVSANPASAMTFDRAPNGSLQLNSPGRASPTFQAPAVTSVTQKPRAQSVPAALMVRDRHAMAPAPPAIASDMAAGRRATLKYLTNLAAAKAAGYRIITRMIPDMGYHFMNASVKGFSIRKPPILVYEHHGHSWQLGAFEWVFTSKPAKPPLPGARYGVFGAACHYDDGTLVYQSDSSKCAAKSPRTGAAFNFWHPRLITLHLWLWYPNPSGMFSGMNPLVAPFNHG